MSDAVVLQLLRAVHADVMDIKADVHEVKQRLGVLGSQYASLSRRMDRLAGDVYCIKSCLGLPEPSPAGGRGQGEGGVSVERRP